MKKLLLPVLGLCLALSPTWAQKKKEAVEPLPYKNPKLDADTRARDLLNRMTLEEKIGQMTQISTTEINSITNPKNKAERFQPFLDEAKAAKFVKEYHVGSFLAAFAVKPEQWYEFSYKLQKTALENSRLGIPIIYGNDHVHGANYISGATIFPQPFNLGATFQPEYARQMGRITALETADLGQHWNFAPILDVGRNTYWPRLYETFGEDTWLATQLGKAYISALQNETEIAPYRIAATAKHFIGYSDPRSGWDRAPSVIPPQELREFFLPPFREAIQTGVKTFMINSGEVNGVPVHASAALINGLLRKELGFDGVVVSDWADILQLVGEHKYAPNEKEATRMALMAGIDMSMTATTTSFCRVVKELVDEGSLPIEVVNKATYRILKLKFELGLFENPYPRKDRLARIGQTESKKIALEAARESIVLLKNEGNLLPIGPSTTRILVAGPSAHSKRNISGGWTIEWNGAPESRFPESAETVFSGLKKTLPKAQIDTATRLSGNEAKIAQADLVILALGEEPYAEGNGNIRDLTLPDDQLDWIRAVQKAGKAHVVVMLAGRPRVIPEGLMKAIPAFVFAGLPGPEGGQALADILSGGVNPSGKLAFSYPATPGHVVPYTVKAHDRITNLFPFGSGMGYSPLEYSDLRLSDTLINRNKALVAQVTVINKGNRPAQEAVLWFVKDEIRTAATPPMKKLGHFDKQALKPGEIKTFEWVIRPSQHLSFPDENGQNLIEPGYFEVQVGTLKKRFQVVNAGASTRQQTLDGSHLQINLID